MLMMPLLGMIMRDSFIILNNLNIFSTFFKTPIPWTSLYIAPISCSIKHFSSIKRETAFLFFTHNWLGLARYRKNRIPRIPANELPILPASTPFSSFSFQKFMFSLPSVPPHLPLTLQPFLILSILTIPGMGFLGTNWSLLLLNPEEALQSSLLDVSAVANSPHCLLLLEPHFFLASGKSHASGVHWSFQLLLCNLLSWHPIFYPTLNEFLRLGKTYGQKGAGTRIQNRTSLYVCSLSVFLVCLVLSFSSEDGL